MQLDKAAGGWKPTKARKQQRPEPLVRGVHPPGMLRGASSPLMRSAGVLFKLPA
jgi:hypothetical protein